jgi:hypothetical protein
MREWRTSGSVGGGGEQSPSSTRLSLGHSIFQFVSNFDIRISHFATAFGVNYALWAWTSVGASGLGSLRGKARMPRSSERAHLKGRAHPKGWG